MKILTMLFTSIFAVACGGTDRVSGVVYYDYNANQLQDDGEEGLSGFVVFIDADNDNVYTDGEPAAATNSDGEWFFEPDSLQEYDEPYKLMVRLPMGWSNTVAAQEGELGQSSGPIIGGVDAAENKYPFMASLSVGANHFCGATLISSRHLLTAAHCVDGNSVPVTSAKALLSTTKRSKPGVVADIADITIHPEYSTSFKDAAIITLTDSYMIHRAPIMTPGLREDLEKDATPATAIGWGVWDTAGNIPDHLQEAETQIMSRQRCREVYGNSVRDWEICISEELNEGACNGDSGGPALVKNGDNWVHFGIASWVNDCRSGDWPVVYARTSAFTDFITSEVGVETSLTVEAAQGDDIVFGLFH